MSSTVKGAKVDDFQALMDWFLERGQTLSVAESCTGGLFSSRIVQHPGVSSFFMGGVVAYSNQVKNEMLGVPLHLLKVLGAVSQPVALLMAKGVCQRIGSDWGVAITGVAGPTGETDRVPVGRVCFGIVGPLFEYAEEQQFQGSREEVQKASVQHGAKLLLNHLK